MFAKTLLALAVAGVLVGSNAASYDLGQRAVTARVPAAVAQCSHADAAKRAQCLAWTISTGEDL